MVLIIVDFRIADIKSVDGSAISCFCLHECESSSRMGSRPRRYLFTGHLNGIIQIWDISTALDLFNQTKDKKKGTSSVIYNCSGGRVVRASAFVAASLGFIPSRIKPVTLKLVFTLQLPCLSFSIKGTVWRTSRRVYQLCRWHRHFARLAIASFTTC